MIINIIYNKKNVIVDIKKETNKNLLDKVMHLINLCAIILPIIPVIALMKYQKKELKKKTLVIEDF